MMMMMGSSNLHFNFKLHRLNYGGICFSVAGMTLHMNGTAMYYPMVALFVAQMKGVYVDPFTMVMLGLEFEKPI